MNTPRQLFLVALTALFLCGTARALTGCGGRCSTDDDCQGQLACISSRCGDDPDVGTHLCNSKGSPASSSPTPSSSTPSSCGTACSSNDDCPGELACMSGKCNDDPDVGTHICNNASPSTGSSPSAESCKASSYLVGIGHSCNSDHNSDCCVSGTRYPQYHCSPPVTASTAAVLTINGFGAGADGGAPSKCDSKFHSDSELIVALSTGWYAGGSRCNKKIRITAPNGRSVLPKVVDECDTVDGCDADHDYQPPCPYNDVDASPAVWKALGISSSDSNYGQLAVTWADA